MPCTIAARPPKGSPGAAGLRLPERVLRADEEHASGLRVAASRRAALVENIDHAVVEVFLVEQVVYGGRVLPVGPFPSELDVEQGVGGHHAGEAVVLIIVVALMPDIAPRCAKLGFIGDTPEQAQVCELLRDEWHVFTGHVDAAVGSRAKSRLLIGETPGKFDCGRHRPLPGELHPPTAGRREVRIGAEGDHDRTEIDFVIEIYVVQIGAQLQHASAIFDTRFPLSGGLRFEQIAGCSGAVFIDVGDAKARTQLGVDLQTAGYCLAETDLPCARLLCLGLVGGTETCSYAMVGHVLCARSQRELGRGRHLSVVLYVSARALLCPGSARSGRPERAQRGREAAVVVPSAPIDTGYQDIADPERGERPSHAWRERDVVLSDPRVRGRRKIRKIGDGVAVAIRKICGKTEGSKRTAE